MKASGFIIPGLVVLLLFACKEDVPIPADNTEASCVSAPLGITEGANTLYPEQVAWPGFDKVWQWHRSYDTLTVKITTSQCTSSFTRYFVFVVGECATLIRDYQRISGGLPYPGNPPPQPTFNEYDLNFQLQQWKEGEILVGKNNDTEIWLELNADNMY